MLSNIIFNDFFAVFDLPLLILCIYKLQFLTCAVLLPNLGMFLHRY